MKEFCIDEALIRKPSIVKDVAFKTITEYLQKYFADLYNPESKEGKKYKSSFGRFFSKRGKKGYDRALDLLKKLNENNVKTKDILKLISENAGTGTLFEMLLEKFANLFAKPPTNPVFIKISLNFQKKDFFKKFYFGLNELDSWHSRYPYSR